MSIGSVSVLSFETFAAKEADGSLSKFMLVVPARCGLKHADSIRVDGNSVLALANRSILPLDFSELTPSALASILEFSLLGKLLPVAEFTASGLLTSYFLEIVIV